ncbi:MAG: peptide deformylase [Holdemania massiliensis]
MDDHPGYVIRNARIKGKGLLLQDREVTFRASGYVAIVLQHETIISAAFCSMTGNPDDPYAPVENAIVIE